MSKPELTIGKLSDFRPQVQNANKHTERGLRMLDDAMSQDGYVAPATAAADGEMIDGSARLERAFDRFADEAIIVKHDGKRPIITVRTDIPNAATEAAKRIAVAANRIAEADLDWDVDVLQTLSAEDLEKLFNDNELARIMDLEVQPDDPQQHWQGMPEFYQTDNKAYRTLIVHFGTAADLENFAKAYNLAVTDRTKFVWIPKQPVQRITDAEYVES